MFFILQAFEGMYIFADMKGDILCPHCIDCGRKSPLLGKYEDIRGTGELFLWCKKCKREVRINLDSLSVDK